jgi:hypothetical protein
MDQLFSHQRAECSSAASRRTIELKQKEERKRKQFRLTTACERNDTSEIRRLLDNGASAIEPWEAGVFSPLRTVIDSNQLSGSVESAQALLDHGALVNAQEGSSLISPLDMSTTKRNVAMSKLLLMYGADPNLQDRSGWSALHNACYYGPLELALLLVRYGANVYLKNNLDMTPLRICVIGDANLSSHEVESAFITREEKWLRCKAFVTVRSWIYGSGAFLAKQRKLLPNQRQAAMLVTSTKPKEWEAADKVLGNPDLCRYIIQYI